MSLVALLLGLMIGATVATLILWGLNIPWVHQRLQGAYGWLYKKTIRPMVPPIFTPPNWIWVYRFLGELVRVGGNLNRARWDVTRQVMKEQGLSEDLRLQADQAFREDRVSKPEWRRICQQLRRHPTLAESWLSIFWRMALANGHVHRQELVRIKLWASWMQVPKKMQDRILNKMLPQEQLQAFSDQARYQEALITLGVTHDEDIKSIKLTYRRLISRYHPDKLNSLLEVKESDIKLAVETTQQIKMAYDIIRSHRGFH